MDNFFLQNIDKYSDKISALIKDLPKDKYSLYLRGSASQKNIKYIPWDIDLVLFLYVEKSQDLEKNLNKKINRINKSLLVENLPHFDVSIIFFKDINLLLSKFVMFNLYHASFFISGLKDGLNEVVSSMNDDELYKVYNYYLFLIFKKTAEVQYNFLFFNHCNTYFYRRYRHIVKLIGRLGCVLLYIEKKEFTRDVNIGLKYLDRLIPSRIIYELMMILDYSELKNNEQRIIYEALEYFDLNRNNL